MQFQGHCSGIRPPEPCHVTLTTLDAWEKRRDLFPLSRRVSPSMYGQKGPGRINNAWLLPALMSKEQETTKWRNVRGSWRVGTRNATVFTEHRSWSALGTASCSPCLNQQVVPWWESEETGGKVFFIYSQRARAILCSQRLRIRYSTSTPPLALLLNKGCQKWLVGELGWREEVEG